MFGAGGLCVAGGQQDGAVADLHGDDPEFTDD